MQWLSPKGALPLGPISPLRGVPDRNAGDEAHQACGHCLACSLVGVRSSPLASKSAQCSALCTRRQGQRCCVCWGGWQRISDTLHAIQREVLSPGNPRHSLEGLLPVTKQISTPCLRRLRPGLCRWPASLGGDEDSRQVFRRVLAVGAEPALGLTRYPLCSCQLGGPPRGLPPGGGSSLGRCGCSASGARSPRARETHIGHITRARGSLATAAPAKS